MTRYGTTVLVAAALGMVASVGGCSDSPCVSCPPPPPASGLIASDPILITLPASSSALGQSLSAGDSTVYVALFPGTVPGGSVARVRVVGRSDTVITSVVDGGFDPVPIFAGLGDSIEAVVTDPPYGLVEYSEIEQNKLREGRGGVWRIPPSFDGNKRSPLPRFTVLSREDITELERFFFHGRVCCFRFSFLVRT